MAKRDPILAAFDPLEPGTESSWLVKNCRRNFPMPAVPRSRGSPAGLLTIPQEIRVNILHFLPLVAKTGLQFLPGIKNSPVQRIFLFTRHNPDGFEAAWHYLSLSTVCRTLYHDVKSYFWTRNRFIVYYDEHSLNRWLEVENSCLQLVRHLTVKTGPLYINVSNEKHWPRQCTLSMTIKPLELAMIDEEWEIMFWSWTPPPDVDPGNVIDNKWTVAQHHWAEDILEKCIYVSINARTLLEEVSGGRLDSTINRSIVNGFQYLRQNFLP